VTDDEQRQVIAAYTATTITSCLSHFESRTHDSREAWVTAKSDPTLFHIS
jgi:hypothetical protein